MKKLFRVRESNPSQNLVVAVETWLPRLGVRVTRESIDDYLLSHPYFPSLGAAADALQDWGIKTHAVDCPVEMLERMPLPCLARLREDMERFVVIVEAEGEIVQYEDTRRGFVTEALSDFARRWTGTLLLAEPVENAGEDDYARKWRIERLARLSSQTAWPMAAALLIGMVAVMAILVPSPASILPALAIKTLGLALSASLVAHYFNPGLSLLSRVCRKGPRVDCVKALDSPASKLFGLIPMADIGAVYFAGGLLALALGILGRETGPTLWLLSALNLCALPYTVYSLWYQARRLRRWCWPCVGVQAALWLEFVTLPGLNAPEISWQATAWTTLSFVLPALLWWAVRPSLSNARQTAHWRRQYERLRCHPEVIDFRLQWRPVEDMGEFAAELRLGSQEAGHQLTIVLHPECAPCAREYAELKRLLRACPEQVSAVIRFFCPETASVGREMARRISALTLSGHAKEANQMLSDWFDSLGKPVGKRTPAKAFSAGELERGERLVESYAQWAEGRDIQATPSVFFNGRRLPDDVRLSDLKFLLKYSAA